MGVRRNLLVMPGSNGKPKRFKSGSQSQSVEEMPSSPHGLKLSAVAEVVARLGKMDIVKRRVHVCGKKLCFNCLKFIHHVIACCSTKRCDQCGKKHHSLLHQEKTAAKTPEEEVHQAGLIATTVKPHGTPPAFLMTSVAEIKSVRRARV